MGLLDGDIARAVAAAAGPILLTFTLSRPDASGYDPALGAPTGVSTTDSTCKGMMVELADDEGPQPDGTAHLRDRKVMVLAASISPAIVPEPGDVLRDNAGFHWRIVGRVTADPAAATYSFRATPAAGGTE